MEQRIKIAARLYHVRDTAKRFFREDYLEKLKPYTHILQAVCKANEIDELQALIRCLQLESIAGNGMAQMVMIAAAVEMMEPSIPDRPTTPPTQPVGY